MASVPSGSRESTSVRAGWGWIAVCAAVTAAAIVAAVNLREQLRWEQRRHFEDAKEIANLSARLETANRSLEEERALVEALARGDADVVPLAPSAGAAAGHLVWNADDGRATLLASGLEPPGADAIYELWLAPPGGPPRSVSRFAPESDGRAWQRARLPGVKSLERVTVTLEARHGDDPEPSGRVVLAGAK